MTAIRSNIIRDLYTCEQFTSCINKIQPDYIRDDLRNEVALILLQQPPGRVEILHERGELIFFAVRTAWNCATLKTNAINKKLIKRNHLVEYNDELSEVVPVVELNGRVQKELSQEPAYSMILRIKQLAFQSPPNYITELYPVLSWYQQYMLSLYMRHGTYRNVAQEVGIPYKACFEAVSAGVNALREYYNGSKLKINDEH